MKGTGVGPRDEPSLCKTSLNTPPGLSLFQANIRLIKNHVKANGKRQIQDDNFLNQEMDKLKLSKMILMDESDFKLLILCTSMNSSCQEMGKLGHVEQSDLTLFRKRDSKVSRRESLQNSVYIPTGYIRNSRNSYQ